jgi:hypothetical protein
MLAIQTRRILTAPDQLIVREARNLFGQSLRGPYLPPEDLPKAEALFRRFADGVPTEGDLTQMFDHWAVKVDAGERASRQGERWEGRADPSPSLAAFIARYPNEWAATVRVYVERALGWPASGKEMKRVMRHLDQCRALRASARADFYINWRIATGKRMQHDRWDDLRHCINSVYADVFVTRDKALKAAFQEIRPGPRILTVAEFAALLAIPYSGP